MIVNELYDGQGLGNQVWNYVLARIIADRRRCSFSILGREKFKGRDFMKIDFGEKLAGGYSPEGGPPLKLPDGILNYYREKKEVIRGTTIDISRTDPDLLNIPEKTKFDGVCQSTKYLEGYRDKITTWLKFDKNQPTENLDENTCAIHMRCGDFTSIKDVFLPAEYYTRAMSHIQSINPKVKFYCVTDQKEVAEKFLPKEVKIVGSAQLGSKDPNMASHHHGGPIDVDFTILMNAHYLIIPNSSFSWWAAYLNQNKKMVIAPKFWARHNVGDGFWSTSDIITDDFTYLDKNGNVFDSNTCWDEKRAFESAHKNLFVEADKDLRKMPTKFSMFKSKIRVNLKNIIRKIL